MNSRFSRIHQCATAVVFAALLLLVSAVSAKPLPASGVTPINNAEYAAAVRELFQKAQKSITVCLYQARFYPEYPETVTNYFVKDLIAAQQRGVKVRVLVDTGDWNPNTKNEYNLEFVDMLTTSGIEVWEDDPKTVSHQKVICIDDEISVVASVNWTFYSVARNNEVGAIIYSAPVNAALKEYWRKHAAAGSARANATAANVSQPVPPASPNPAAEAAAAKRVGRRVMPATEVEILADRDFYPGVRDAILGAKSQITVVQRSMNRTAGAGRTTTPSLPGQPASLVNALTELIASAAKRGVKPTIILDKTGTMDNAANEETAAFYKDRGITVYHEDPENQTHAKFLTMDDKTTILGSTNWTKPALENGNEVSVRIVSPEVNAYYTKFAQDLKAKGGVLVPSKTSAWAGSAPRPMDARQELRGD